MYFANQISLLFKALWIVNYFESQSCRVGDPQIGGGVKGKLPIKPNLHESYEFYTSLTLKKMRKKIRQKLDFLSFERQEVREKIKQKLEKRKLQNRKRRAEIKSGAKVGQAPRGRHDGSEG